MDTVENRPATIAAWSFSRLEIFEKCPYWAYLEFVKKEPKPELPSDNKGAVAAARGTAIHTSAEMYIKGEGQLIDELKKPVVLERIEHCKAKFAAGVGIVEEDWGFTNEWQPTGYYANDVWLRVKCDYVGFEDNVLDVDDWKSGKRYGNEVKHSQQGILYAISGFVKYPEAEKVRIRFTYVDENKSYPREYDRATIMRLMPSWHERGMAMTTATEFRPKPNKINCRFCPYGPNNGGNRTCKSGVEL